MKILGNRVLVSKIEEEVKEGFKTIEVQDNFVYKGRVEMVGDETYETVDMNMRPLTAERPIRLISVGDVVLFAKYSPDTHEIDHEGKKMKIVRVEDILAVL